jgi:hypothetical protein
MSLRIVTTKIFKSAVRARAGKTKVCLVQHGGGAAYRRTFVKHSSAQAISDLRAMRT